MKEKKKINFIGFWEGFDKKNNLFYDILSEEFDIEISETPDFLIASCLGKPLEYLQYDCVRILYTGEPLVPDFNVFDYAIGFDYLSFSDDKVGDRYYRFPYCLYSDNRKKREMFNELGRGLKVEEARSILKKKKYFCNFVYGHQSADGKREQILKLIQEYKSVLSVGSYKNNMPDGTHISRAEKPNYLRMSKFTISCESISYPGFVTEKIVDPFLSQSVPIYYGNPLIGKDFNENAMINLHKYDTLEDGINYLMEIDKDEEKYLNMLMQPKLVNPDYYLKLYDGFRNWLFSIFSQTGENSYRRMRYYIQKEHEKYLDEYRSFSNSYIYKFFKMINR